MSGNPYWIEAVSQSFDEAGIAATSEQIESVAKLIEGYHENIGLARYSPPPEEHFRFEQRQLEQRVERARELITCTVCRGNGGVWVTVEERNISARGRVLRQRCEGSGRHERGLS